MTRGAGAGQDGRGPRPRRGEGFDPVQVAARSLMSGWIRDETTVAGCHEVRAAGRAALGTRRRGVEDIPRHAELRGRSNPW